MIKHYNCIALNHDCLSSMVFTACAYSLFITPFKGPQSMFCIRRIYRNHKVRIDTLYALGMSHHGKHLCVDKRSLAKTFCRYNISTLQTQAQCTHTTHGFIIRQAQHYTNYIARIPPMYVRCRFVHEIHSRHWHSFRSLQMLTWPSTVHSSTCSA